MLWRTLLSEIVRTLVLAANPWSDRGRVFFFLVINLEITYFYILVTDFNLIICHSALKLFFA